MALDPTAQKYLEELQDSPASAALRLVVFSHRKRWSISLLQHPDATSDRAREYAAGAAAALESLYDDLGKLLNWRKAPQERPGFGGELSPQSPQSPPPPPGA